jgi:hypothetical protein
MHAGTWRATGTRCSQRRSSTTRTAASWKSAKRAGDSNSVESTSGPLQHSQGRYSSFPRPLPRLNRDRFPPRASDVASCCPAALPRSAAAAIAAPLSSPSWPDRLAASPSAPSVIPPGTSRSARLCSSSSASSRAVSCSLASLPPHRVSSAEPPPHPNRLRRAAPHAGGHTGQHGRAGAPQAHEVAVLRLKRVVPVQKRLRHAAPGTPFSSTHRLPAPLALRGGVRPRGRGGRAEEGRAGALKRASSGESRAARWRSWRRSWSRKRSAGSAAASCPAC